MIGIGIFPILIVLVAIQAFTVRYVLKRLRDSWSSLWIIGLVLIWAPPLSYTYLCSYRIQYGSGMWQSGGAFYALMYIGAPYLVVTIIVTAIFLMRTFAIYKATRGKADAYHL